jgi:hypothetical protein
MYSYSKKGQRAYAQYNWQLKNQTNAIGAIESNQLITVGLFDTSVNTAVFECWIEQDLLPKLTTTSVLIMDNATFHKGKRLLELIKAAGHYLIWLPTYSPDLNPIDERYIVQGGQDLKVLETSLEFKILMRYLKFTVMSYSVISYSSWQ